MPEVRRTHLNLFYQIYYMKNAQNKEWHIRRLFKYISMLKYLFNGGRKQAVPESARGRRFLEGQWWGLQNRKHGALITHTRTYSTWHLHIKKVYGHVAPHIWKLFTVRKRVGVCVCVTETEHLLMLYLTHCVCGLGVDIMFRAYGTNQMITS